MYHADHAYQKTNNTFINNAEDLDIAMPMYDLVEYRNNYSLTTGTFWNCYRDKINFDVSENNLTKNRVNNNKTIASTYFEYKTR